MQVRCWEYFKCRQNKCPAHSSKDLRCWLLSETYARPEILGKFIKKVELCIECKVFHNNLTPEYAQETLISLINEFRSYREKVERRKHEWEHINLELAVGLSQVFDALQKLAAGDPTVRISEGSELELISKLKKLVNRTAEEFSDMVDLTHEFAMGLAEHFDVLHRVSTGNLSARVKGSSSLELLESLKEMTNKMIESVAREIAERKKAEEALRESEAELRSSEEKYRSLFDNGPDPVFVLDRATLKILDANTSAETSYGYSRDELIGKSFLELGAGEELQTGLERLNENNSGESCLIYSKARHYKKGMIPFYVNAHACATKYMGKDALIVSITDITEMIEKDALLIQASKMTTLGEMSAGIAHELNQPLNAIKMGNEYLKMLVEQGREIPREHLQRVVREVSEQVDRAAEIINRLREFGRKSEYVNEKVDVNGCIRNVVALMGQQLKLQNIRLRVDLEENLPPILAHSNRIEQVIFNLLTNARDAISQRGEASMMEGENVIRVRSFMEDSSINVTVSDTGVGIPDELKAKIFEPFFTTKEVGKGLGLGLAITYGIVKDYGGNISVHSGIGVGTTFKLSFPPAQ